MGTIHEELEKELADPRKPALIIAGAGLAVAATEGQAVASWLGLLQHGVDHCEQYVPNLPQGWGNRLREQLGSGDKIELISVAENVASRLGAPRGGEFAHWLKDTIGSLKPSAPRLLAALAAWQVQIATTNYDELIETVAGRKPITWKDRSLVLGQFLHQETQDVLHFHGVWRRPESVILGLRSYKDILKDEPTQDMLKALMMMRTLVFVGCGAGMQDPNFGALLEWSRRVLAESPHRHFRLACTQELDEVRKQHNEAERIAFVEYGKSYQDLPSYAEAVAERLRARAVPKPGPFHQLVAAQTDFDRQCQELEAGRLGMGSPRYIRTLHELAASLWQSGGLRSAWMRLATAFDQEAAVLEVGERLNVGVELAQMMMDDDAPDHAVSILQRLKEDVTKAGDPAVVGRYWDLQVRCFTSLCAYGEALQATEAAIATAGDDHARARLRAERAELRFLQGEAVESSGSRQGGEAP